MDAKIPKFLRHTVMYDYFWLYSIDAQMKKIVELRGKLCVLR